MIDAPLFETMRLLEAENAALRAKLARHELRQLTRELSSPNPFGSSQNEVALVDPIIIPELDDHALHPLLVPMGSIEAQETPANLPVIGVFDDRLSGPNLAAALLGILTTQYTAPFARLVFLCSRFEAVPLLGRYGFATEVLGPQKPEDAFARLSRRYGVKQIRSLATGAVLIEG